MQFTDYNRTDTYYWLRNRDVPWIGTVLDGDGAIPRTPEGDVLPMDLAKVPTVTDSNFTRICPFPEWDEPYPWHLETITPAFLYDINDEFEEGATPARVVQGHQFRCGDSEWCRHTVTNMTRGVCVRSVQDVREDLRCATFFMEQAVDLDIPRYLEQEERGDAKKRFLIVNDMQFILSSSFVAMGNPVEFPPRKMYFYERMHDYKTISDFATPWGYWSTERMPISEFPGPNASREEVRAFTKRTQTEIQFLGVSDKCKFVWMQTVAGVCFRTEVMIAVHCYHWTADERLVLRELSRCLTEAYKEFPQLPQQEIRNSIRQKRARDEDSDPDNGGDDVPRKRLKMTALDILGDTETDEEDEDDEDSDEDTDEDMDTDSNSEDDSTDEDVDMDTEYDSQDDLD
ncbi:hypothetical protein NUW54_g595 [Trametes sanguinea]|uniref:Uncharacterized protein n=1 Tax=Trametes sanguinea TaxID=158606 RepID=A0ACC1QAK7_9APHY|nr:hypothetical protein NUW54_g595 [Trametes sanguinea]